MIRQGLAAIFALALTGCAGPAEKPGPGATRPAAVRAQIEAEYARLRSALMRGDAEAVIAQRTGDFAVATPDGATHDAAEMAGFTRQQATAVKQWVALSYEIGPIETDGPEAAADVRQHSIRMQVRGDGLVHRIENWVTQRETWRRTPAGWKVRRVDNIRDQTVLIDGKPR